jgi:AmmeMemoRadiSam system protein B/AmmeMemoRadiSam system protein A
VNNVRLFTIFTISLLFLCGDCRSQEVRKDRRPAVAGQFYPAGREDLDMMMKQLFAKAAPKRNIRNVVAVISPHAGYVFSGEVAASSYNQIDPEKRCENIFVIGSSHYIAFDGASIYSQGDFITPLGKVKVNTILAKDLIKNNNVFSDRMDAHATEHSLEVQLPFLQYRLKKEITIVPIILGTQSPETCRRIAEALRPYFNPKNLFVISTDFSHYPSYADAKNVDKATADAICANSAENLVRSLANYERKGIHNLATCLCGWTSVLTLLYMTEGNPDVVFTQIQYKNSGDTEYGEKDRVVGYNAITVSLNERKTGAEFKLSDNDKKELLAIARKTVEQYVKNRRKPELDEKNLPRSLKVKSGAFVTLRKHGDLRGCIGHFEADKSLYEIVQEMAIASSTQDYRFPPVEPQEIPGLEIEISVLTPMRRVGSIDEIVLGKHGIYIRKGLHSGTFLPQVATETGWTKEEFLGHCAQDKAGIGWNGWKDAEIFVYEAIVFGENSK